MKDYVGKVVFVGAALNNKGVLSSGYGKTGEFIVVKQSPFQLYCVSTKGGYDSHELKHICVEQFDENGSKFEILDARDDREYVKEFGQSLLAFSRSETKNWIDSVYQNAGVNARMVFKALGVDSLPEQAVLRIEDKRAVKKDPNTLVLLSPEMNSLIDKTCSAKEIRPIVERAYFEILTLLQKERK